MITFQHSTRRTVGAAVLLPLATAAVQFVLWPYLQPFAWLLFYPAVLLAAWVGGRRAGLLASLLSAGLVIYIFVPPMFAVQLDKPGALFGAAIFIGMGYLFSFIFDRWRRATARADVLEQLQASEARYAELVQHANSAIFRWRVDGTIVFANEYAQQLFGYTAAQLIGQPVSLMLPPHDSTGADLSTLVQDIAAHPENFKQNVNENVCRDGRRIWLAWTNTPVRDDHGQVTEILAVGTDITARKQAEEALQISQARLSFALEKSHTGGWDLDLIDHTAVRTLEHDRIFGYDTLLPRWTYEMFLEHVLEEDRAEVNRLFQAAVAAGGDWDFECRIRRVDGEIRWIRANGGHQPGEHRAPRRMAGIVQDITPRKQADEALRASEDGLKRAEAAAHIGHWTWDVRSNRVSWSAEMYRIFGLNPIGFSGDLAEVIRTAIHPDDRAKVEAANTAVSDAAQPAPLDYRVVWPDGTVRVVHAAPAEATRDAQGRVVRLFGTVQDITDRAQAEQRVKYLSRLYATLSQVNQAIVRVNDRATLFNAICQVAIDFGEFKLAWIGLGDLVTGQITLAAQYGQSDVHLPIEPFNLNEEPFRSGVMGRAVAGGQVETVNDVQGDPRMAHWHDFARQHNYQSIAAIPIRQQGQVVGALNLYAEDADFFNAPEEISLLIEMGLDISFALDTYQLEAERRQAAEALKESEAQYRFLVDNTSDFIARYDQAGVALFASGAAPYFNGFAPEELIHTSAFDRIYPADHDRVRRELKRVIDTGEAGHIEYRVRRKSGDYIWVDATGQRVFNAAGEPEVIVAQRNITQRKQAEAALKASEERYRMAQTIGHVGNWEYNLQTAEFWGSPEARRIYGFDPDQATFSTDEVESCIPERERVHQALIDLIESDKPYNLQFEIVPKNSSGTRIITSIAQLRRDEHGRPLLVTGVIQDITERWRAEEALRASEERYRLISENSADVIWVLDPLAGQFKYVSPSVQKLRGYTPAEVLAQPMSAALTPESLQLVSELMATQLPAFLAQGGGTVSFVNELDQPRKDGSIVHTEVTTTVLQNSANQIEIVGVSRDITERKAMEAKLRESEERFRALYENAPLAYQSLDEAGYFLDVNPAWLQTLGYELSEVIGRHFSEFLHPDYAAHFSRSFAEFKRRGDVHDVEHRLKHKAGHYLDVTYEGRIGYWPDGRFRQTYCVFQDITQRKQAEAAVQQLTTELEERVAQRTHELAAANASLAQAVEQLTELDQLKSKFVSDVSHELRTPITSLSLYIDLLEHGKPEKRERYVTGLKEQMARLHKLINDILDLSRLERDEGGRSLIDLNSIAEHVTAMERGSAEAAGLTLTCEVAENLPPVVARPDQLTRALTNLVSNAIKYTAAGSVRVQTRLDAQRVCLEVRDTGRGIPADELPHVFERFYRGKGVSQSTIPGTGLGLSIVKEIIESHGGTVEVESTVGVGSTFRVWLPVAAG